MVYGGALSRDVFIIKLKELMVRLIHLHARLQYLLSGKRCILQQNLSAVSSRAGCGGGHCPSCTTSKRGIPLPCTAFRDSVSAAGNSVPGVDGASNQCRRPWFECSAHLLDRAALKLPLRLDWSVAQSSDPTEGAGVCLE